MPKANQMYPRVAQTVLDLHEKKRVPYSEIARELRVSESTLRNYRSGQTPWRLDSITRLSLLIDKPISWLLTSDEEEGEGHAEEG